MWTVSPSMDGTTGTTGIHMQVPAGLFLCAGAVLESPRLAIGSPVDAKSPMLSRDAPKTSQLRPRCPKVCPKTAQSGPKTPKGSRNKDKRTAMQSPKHALALQSELKGVLYTPKLPINRTRLYYAIPKKPGTRSPYHANQIQAKVEL